MEVYRRIKTQSSTLPFHPKSALYCAPGHFIANVLVPCFIEGSAGQHHLQCTRSVVRFFHKPDG